MPDGKYAPGYNGQPGEAHNKKPDKEEPWRYVCPCGGQPAHWSLGKYECVTCGEILTEDELVDLKEQ